jgi:hypothetical protein
LLPGVLPDIADLAVLGASLRLEREIGTGPSAFTAGMGLVPKWRSASRSVLVRQMIVDIPTKVTEPCGSRPRSRCGAPQG